MRISTKILIGFLSIIILIFAQTAIIYKLQGDILNNTKQIKDVETPLELMVEQVIGYDAMLTGTAHVSLLHAEKGDFNENKLQKAKYDEIGIKLDDLLKKDARILLRQSKRTQEQADKVDMYLKELDRINLVLVDLETRAFEAMGKNDTETAYSLIVSENYHKYKEELYQDYLAWKNIEHEVTLNIRDNILKDSQQIIYLCSGISVLIMITVILTMLIIRSFVAAKETEIVKKEKSLNIREKMEQKYRNLFEKATDAIFIADVETRQLVDCNESAEKLIGYSRAEILSMKADELHPKDKLKKTMEGFKKQSEGKIKSVFTEILTKDNKRIAVKINASAISIENKLYNQGIFTELK